MSDSNTAPKPAHEPGAHKSKTAVRKVFDVQRPGRAPAAATSKPVIMGHKPVHDPVVKSSAHRPLMGHNKAPEITPVETVASQNAFAPQEVPTPPSDGQAIAQAGAPAPTTSVQTNAPVEQATVPPQPAGAAPLTQPASPVGLEPQPPAQAVSAVPQTSVAPSTEPAPAPPAIPSVADQIAAGSLPTAKSIKPLPKEAFDALANEPASHSEPPSGALVVSHASHSGSILKAFLIVLLLIGIVAIALNFLIDAEILVIDGVPHTELIDR